MLNLSRSDQPSALFDVFSVLWGALFETPDNRLLLFLCLLKSEEQETKERVFTQQFPRSSSRAFCASAAVFRTGTSCRRSASSNSGR
jgi:hypothetical protein